MILPNPQCAVHLGQMFRILTEISDDSVLSKALRFKGGTCAAMQGLVNRFSVDLDFDLLDIEQQQVIRNSFEKIFDKLGLEIKDQSSQIPQYFVRYKAATDQRNTIKIDTQYPPPTNNQYEPVKFIDIDRFLLCQTKETMLANKLVAPLDRFQKHQSFASRDVFDIHSFLMQNLSYNSEVILERTKLSLPEFFQRLISFIDEQLTETVINQDLNSLLQPKDFQQVRKYLKIETLRLLRAEAARVE